jgi:hypothetical protein
MNWKGEGVGVGVARIRKLVSVTQIVLFELTNHKHSECSNNKASNVSKTGTMRSFGVTMVAVEKQKCYIL